MARDGGRRKRPAPAPTGAATGVGTAERPRPPAGLLRPDDVLELQRTAGNRAVSDAISVQRAGPGTGTVAPARQQLDRALSSMDFVAIAAVKDFSPATDPERLTMLRALATVHKMGRLESGATKRIWQSFGKRLAVAASEQSALWDLCQSKGAKLPTSWLGAGQGSRKFDFTEQVGGNVFVGTGAYEYRVKADAIVVTVGMNFKPDRGVNRPDEHVVRLHHLDLEPLQRGEPGRSDPEEAHRLPAGRRAWARDPGLGGHRAGQRRALLRR
jgi:hypothetical protein